jgi:hypothetical protein
MNLSKAKWFKKLDIHSAYTLIHMAEGEEWKTAFYPCYGLFESLVMPFSLTNTMAMFQNYINDVLAHYLDHFCTAYQDDTVIDLHNFEEHQQHIQLLLDAFAMAGLHLKPKKCEFHHQVAKYLRLIISTEGIKMDLEKIRAIQDWGPPSNLNHIHPFLDFANFYCQFVCSYSCIVHPLTFLTRKGVPFAWTKEQQTAFDTLKDTFISVPVLAPLDPDRDVIVEMDTSNYVSTAILSQYDDDNVLYPVAYFSKKHSATECNYEIYDQELMAVVQVFEEWRPEL